MGYNGGRSFSMSDTPFLREPENPGPVGVKYGEADDDLIPIHWMGNNKVEMMMVRRDDVKYGKGTDKATRKEGLKQRENERKAWKRLVKESESLVHGSVPPQLIKDPTPDPVVDLQYRNQILAKLRPPPRMTHTGEVERSRGFYPESEASLVERSSAANLITSLFRGESTRMGLKALCPFSGTMVPLGGLGPHMEEWRALMKAELMSLRMDAALGPKLGLFVIPEIPEIEPPMKGASAEEVKKWSDFSMGLLKSGYVLCKTDDKKYHWTEIRKRLEEPASPRHVVWDSARRSRSGSVTSTGMRTPRRRSFVAGAGAQE